MGANLSSTSAELESFFCDQKFSFDTAFISVCKEGDEKRPSRVRSNRNGSNLAGHPSQTRTGESINESAAEGQLHGYAEQHNQRKLEIDTSQEFDEPPRRNPTIVGQRSSRRKLLLDFQERYPDAKPQAITREPSLRPNLGNLDSRVLPTAEIAAVPPEAGSDPSETAAGRRGLYPPCVVTPSISRGPSIDAGSPLRCAPAGVDQLSHTIF